MTSRLIDLRRWPAQGFLKLLCAAVVLTGCGGGGSTSSNGTSSASAGTFAAGPITGFGSVIVGGVRFDDSSATITDDEGNPQVSGDLRLGMIAEIESDNITTDSS